MQCIQILHLFFYVHSSLLIIDYCFHVVVSAADTYFVVADISIIVARAAYSPLTSGCHAKRHGHTRRGHEMKFRLMVPFACFACLA